MPWRVKNLGGIKNDGENQGRQSAYEAILWFFLSRLPI